MCVFKISDVHKSLITFLSQDYVSVRKHSNNAAVQIKLKNVFFQKNIYGVRSVIPQDTYSLCADRAKIMP